MPQIITFEKRILDLGFQLGQSSLVEDVKREIISLIESDIRTETPLKDFPEYATIAETEL